MLNTFIDGYKTETGQLAVSLLPARLGKMGTRIEAYFWGLSPGDYVPVAGAFRLEA